MTETTRTIDRREGARLAGLLVVALFLCNIYDPGGTLHLKYVAFGVASAYAILKINSLDLTVPELIVGLTLFVLWPLCALLQGIARAAEPRLAISQATSFLAIGPLTVLLSHLRPRTAFRLFFGCMLSLAFSVIILFLFEFIAPGNSLSGAVVGYFAQQGSSFGYFGSKPGWDETIPNIYFSATLFLVPTFVYFLWSRRFIVALIIFCGLTASFSKAGVVICLAFCCFYAGYHLRGLFSGRKRGWLRSLSIIMIVAALFFSAGRLFPNFADEVWAGMRGQSDTARVRLLYLRDFAKHANEHPLDLVFGEGTGFYIFSEGESSYNSELDHINMIRRFGLIWFAIFTGGILFISRQLMRGDDQEQQGSGLALLAMFMAAGTNPVLGNPLFLMFMTTCYFAQRRRAVASDAPALVTQFSES